MTAVRADGKPARDATAYAVRVGRVSQTTMPDWPQADVDASGKARIPVPAAGTYDVGVVFPSQEQPRVLVLNVRVEAGATSRVDARLPALAAVEVSIQGAEPGQVAVYAEEADETGSRTSYYPARTERYAARWSFGSPTESVSLPEGLKYEVWLQERDEKGQWKGVMEGWKANPAIVAAPGRVVFRRNMAPILEVPLRFTVSGVIPGGLRNSKFNAWYAEGTPDEMRLDRWITWTDGRPEETSLTIWLGAKSAKVTWSGDGVVPGEGILPGSADVKAGVSPLKIEIRADDMPLIEGIDVEGGRQPPRNDSPFLHAVDPTGDGRERVGFYTQDEYQRLVDLRPGWVATMEWGAWWVSRPVLVPKRGRLRFTLVPSGYLLATSPRVPTPGLGSLTIRRADGEWLGERFADDIRDDKCDGESAWSARPGMILGPLPEGDVELIISLGGEERRRVVGHVKANQITQFPLTW